MHRHHWPLPRHRHHPRRITTFQNNISGFLRDDTRAPLADVTITAKSGDFEGTATSGANGSWNIGVPEQGTYEIELDESTLPEGIKLADGQENPRNVTFSQTSNLSVIFAFGKGIVVQQQDFGQNLLNRLVAGLSFGLLLALAAVGLSLIFGTTGLTNFAHGEMVTLGAVLVFRLQRRWHCPSGWPSSWRCSAAASSATSRTQGCGSRCGAAAPGWSP